MYTRIPLPPPDAARRVLGRIQRNSQAAREVFDFFRQKKKRGLLVISGAVGTGKTTTLGCAASAAGAVLADWRADAEGAERAAAQTRRVVLVWDGCAEETPPWEQIRAAARRGRVVCVWGVEGWRARGARADAQTCFVGPDLRAVARGLRPEARAAAARAVDVARGQARLAEEEGARHSAAALFDVCAPQYGCIEAYAEVADAFAEQDALVQAGVPSALPQTVLGLAFAVGRGQGGLAAGRAQSRKRAAPAPAPTDRGQAHAACFKALRTSLPAHEALESMKVARRLPRATPEEHAMVERSRAAFSAD